MKNGVISLRIQSLVLILPFFNWFVIVILAFISALSYSSRLSDDKQGSMFIRFLVGMVLIVAFCGILFTAGVIIIGNYYGHPISVIPLLIDLYVVTFLMGLGLILYQKILGIK